jgi:putative cell wall-binding protein
LRRLLSIGLSLALLCAVPAGAAATSPTPELHPRLAKATGASAADPAATVRIASTSVGSAVPLVTSPVTASLFNTGDRKLYSIHLMPGDRITLSVTGTRPGVDLYLYGPGTLDVEQAVPLAHASESSYPRVLTYDVPIDLEGTHYIEVYASDGLATFTMNWDVQADLQRAREDVDTAVDIPVGVVTTGTLPPELEANDIYKVTATAGQRITVDLSVTDPSADFDVFLYGPNTTTILSRSVMPAAWANTPKGVEHLIYDVVTGQAGTYYIEVYRFTGDSDYSVRVDVANTPDLPPVRRLSGVSRYATSVSISKDAFPAGSAYAIVCSGESFPDGLAASSLAGALNAPILLTAKSSLPAEVRDEIVRLGASKVLIIGGMNAVSLQVQNAIAAIKWSGLSTERVAGLSRYDTAAQVADKTYAVTHVRPTAVLLASGEGFADALSVSPIAASQGFPIILTRSTSLPPESASALERIKADRWSVELVAAGGEIAISPSVLVQAALTTRGTVTRAAGVTRYDTALVFSEYALNRDWASANFLGLASGVNFPDALGGGALCGRSDGVMLLANGQILGPSAGAFVRSYDFMIDDTVAYGGSFAMAEPILQECRDVIAAVPRHF